MLRCKYTMIRDTPSTYPRPFRENRSLQVLRNTIALNPYPDLFALCYFSIIIIDKGGNSLPKNFEGSPKIRLNL